MALLQTGSAPFSTCRKAITRPASRRRSSANISIPPYRRREVPQAEAPVRRCQNTPRPTTLGSDRSHGRGIVLTKATSLLWSCCPAPHSRRSSPATGGAASVWPGDIRRVVMHGGAATVDIGAYSKVNDPGYRNDIGLVYCGPDGCAAGLVRDVHGDYVTVRIPLRRVPGPRPARAFCVVGRNGDFDYYPRPHPSDDSFRVPLERR